MTRLNVLLLIALLASAMMLVRTAYDGRRLYAELDRARAEQRKLEIDYERLKSEQQGQATPLRVEKVARDRLRMRTPTPAVTEYVAVPGAASAPLLAAGGAR